VLYHLSFSDRFSYFRLLPGLTSDFHPLASAFSVAEITCICHHAWPYEGYLF
jgi:hypothetical protein